MKKIAIVPTLFTLANGVCGFGAITFASRIPRGILPVERPETQWLWYSALLILMAMVFDALDGRVARMARITTDFGGQLDSLCDALSFGVAPAFLMLKLCSDHDRFAENGLWMKVLWIIAVLYVVCALMRLARFNVESEHGIESHLTFTGLPSPAAAGAIASVVILWNELRDPPLTQLLGALGIDPVQIEQMLGVVLPLATVALAGLMVSNLPYPHFANQLFRGHRSFSHVIRVIFALVIVILLRQFTLPLVFWAFAISSPVLFLWNSVRNGRISREAAA